ncbi:hypothetical protein D4A92_22205 (plasmid) [Rhizobium rosettiformans]|uniref:Uncharacterized protein n=1 Tax=Rhizobium rosettiformans TaxID=1368430 RepID=A0ABX7F1S0_9HYPH|nr:hypothetical protein D4A92_22205 [Rhizobium rosettiformans]
MAMEILACTVPISTSSINLVCRDQSFDRLHVAQQFGMLADPADFSAGEGHGHHQHVFLPFGEEAATALPPLQIPVPHAREDQETEGELAERHASTFDNPVRGCRKCPKHQA